MCTAITLRTKDFYFGRTLDYDVLYGNEIVIAPRRYPFSFRHQAPMNEHYAMIGVACVVDDYPLYHEAVNEKGVGIAGLNFVGNAVFHDVQPDQDNIAQFELIPWLLGQCASVSEVKQLLATMNIINTPFSDQFPVAQLHWLIADRHEAITVEAVKNGLMVYSNPVGVLTNNPPFEQQLFQLNNYMHVSAKPAQNHFCSDLPLKQYSRGMGGLGLPGDLTSPSRFVRAAFTKMNAVCAESEAASVSQFFHILGSVEQVRGCCEIETGRYEITQYTCCCNADRGVYYYTTYDRHQITGVDMNQEDLQASKLIRYPLLQNDQIKGQNF